MKRILLAVAALVAIGSVTAVFADGEWQRMGPVWFRNLVYAGSSHVQLTTAAGNLSTTSGAFSGAVSTGNLTVTGTESVSSTLTAAAAVKFTSYGAVTATGTTNADATAITPGVVVVGLSGVTNAGAILPAGGTGNLAFVGNVGSTTPLKLYAPTGGKINNAAANSALSIVANKAYSCVEISATDYLCAGN